jgi:hypothetical protein
MNDAIAGRCGLAIEEYNWEIRAAPADVVLAQNGHGNNQL